MSDEKKSAEELKKFEEQLEAARDLARRKKEIEEKALLLREHKVNVELEILQQNQRDAEESKNVDFSRMSDKAIQELIANNDDYMEAAKNSLTFILKTFKGKVPFFRKNLILIGGDTGDGKSTTVANIVTTTLQQSNPQTGRPCRVLILTNEEAPEDFYNRVTCHIHGWAYTNHDQFTDEQRAIFRKMIPILSQKLQVIGDTHEGITGCTTTPEGVEEIFNNLMTNGDRYDVVLIDYYQNVQRSRIDPKLDQYACQAKFAAVLDKIKMYYGAAIVLMAQMKKLVGEDDQTPFNIRLKGSKIICDKATFIMEIIPEREILRSKWKVWKSRFTDTVGQSFYTGFDKGKFVQWEGEFELKMAAIQAKKLENEIPEEVMKGKKNGSKNKTRT